MQIGYAQTIITPSLDRPVFLAGFAPNRRAETVHDDLYVRALALRDEGCTLILAALDLIGFFQTHVREVVLRVQEKAPGVQIILASIHNHDGPDTMGLWGSDRSHSGVDPDYMATLKDKTAATILASLENLRPAALKAATVHVPGVAKNARNPDVVDDELTVAMFADAQSGQPLASLFDFPCHPEVLWEHNTHISADYPGALRREVEAVTRAPCLFFAGALGGMMTPDVKEHSFEEAEAMGKALAQAGLRALNEATLVDPSPRIKVQKKEIDIKLTNILFKLAFNRHLLPDVRNTKGQITSEVNLIQIGSLWLATIPGELLPKLGLMVKENLRKAGAGVPGVICLANDELGYILPREEFRYPLNPFQPGKHYEETMSISKDIGPIVVGAVQSLVEQ